MIIYVVDITDDQLKRAEQLYDFKATKYSMYDGERMIHGAIGEIAIYDAFKDKLTVEFNSTFDYDLLMNGYRIEAKTKSTSVEPLISYDCDVFRNVDQNCDYYFFARVSKDLKKCYLLGYISKGRFYQTATFTPKGTITKNYQCEFDNYGVKIHHLNQFKSVNLEGIYLLDDDEMKQINTTGRRVDFDGLEY